MTNYASNKLERSCIDHSKIDGYGVRHTVALISFVCAVVTYAMRFVISVTILAMMNQRNSSSPESEVTEFMNETSSTNSYELENFDENSSVDFVWDEKTRGVVRGSFYYGYFITYGIGGRISDYWGGRYPFAITTLISSLLTLLSPLAGSYSSTALIAVRVLHGINEGLGYGCLFKILTQWYPVHERSKYVSFVYSGFTLGTLVSMTVSGWLCTTEFLGGWPAPFYLLGSIGIICSALWLIFVYEDPHNHPRIKENELKYISQGTQEITERASVPWKYILTSRYVWIICFSEFGLMWIEYVISADLPTYFEFALDIDYKNNGLLSSIPFLGATVISIGAGYILTYFQSRNVISLLSLRRISICIGGYISMLGVLLLVFIENKTYNIIILFIIMESFIGAAVCSCFCSSGDIAPRFAGTLNGFTFTFGNMPGFLTPTVTGIMLQYFEPKFAWKIVFLIAALLSGISTTIYVLFITTEIQPWNEPETSETASRCQEKPCNMIKSKENERQKQNIFCDL